MASVQISIEQAKFLADVIGTKCDGNTAFLPMSILNEAIIIAQQADLTAARAQEKVRAANGAAPEAAPEADAKAGVELS